MNPREIVNIIKMRKMKTTGSELIREIKEMVDTYNVCMDDEAPINSKDKLLLNDAIIIHIKFLMSELRKDYGIKG